MKHILNFLFLLYSSISFAQSFEGTLSYAPEIILDEKMEKMGMSSEMLIEEMKEDGTYSDTIVYSYKQGNYHMLLKNPGTTWSIYQSNTNKIYTMHEADDPDLYYVINASIDLENTMSGKMPSIEKLDSTAMIDGVPCNIVRVKWSMGAYDYYYDPTRFAVNPALFSKHIYDGWAAFLQISKALPVRIVKSIPGMFTVTFNLIDSSPGEIKDSLFFVPELVLDKDLNGFGAGNSTVMRIKK